MFGRYGGAKSCVRYGRWAGVSGGVGDHSAGVMASEQRSSGWGRSQGGSAAKQNGQRLKGHAWYLGRSLQGHVARGHGAQNGEAHGEQRLNGQAGTSEKRVSINSLG